LPLNFFPAYGFTIVFSKALKIISRMPVEVCEIPF